jgi:hypothetical protein
MPAEHSTMRMYQDDPFCAQLWYRSTSAPPWWRAASPVRCAPRPIARWHVFPIALAALEQQGMFRTPRCSHLRRRRAPWYANQSDKPLASSRGQLYDHIALSVSDLDAWVASSRARHQAPQPYKLGDTRAAMIEGPSRRRSTSRGQVAVLPAQPMVNKRPVRPRTVRNVTSRWRCACDGIVPSRTRCRC